MRMSPPFTITSFCGYATTVAFLLTTACPTLVAAEKHIDFSEAALQRIGVLSDDTSLGGISLQRCIRPNGHSFHSRFGRKTGQ